MNSIISQRRSHYLVAWPCSDRKVQILSSSILLSFKIIPFGAGEQSEQFRARTAFAEDLSPVPSTYVGQLTPPIAQLQGHPGTPTLLRHLHSCAHTLN